MIIAQLTDTHILGPNHSDRKLTNQRLDNLTSCVTDINQLRPLPDAVIHTGDISQNATLSEYQIAFEVLDKLTPPFFIVPGNRDSRSTMRRVFQKLPFVSHTSDDSFIYPVDNFTIRLIGLDSLCDDDGRGCFCSKRMKKLDNLLMQEPLKPTVLFMHHPPFIIETATTAYLEFQSKKMSDQFLSLITRHKQVFRVFCGHSHQSYTKKIGTILFSTIPSVATDLRRGSYPPNIAEKPIYQIHRHIPLLNFFSETRIAN